MPSLSLKNADKLNEHEVGFLNFLAEPNRGRVSTLLNLGPRRRKDLRELLDHKIKLDQRFAQAVVGYQHSPEQIHKKLISLGAPQMCWMLSADPGLDAHQISLAEGITSLLDSMSGGFVSCVPGRLGFFQYETPGSGFLLIR